MKTLERLTVRDAAAWSHWLASNASTSPGVSLTLAKKGTIDPTSLSMDQAVEEALCYGWINGQGHTIDQWTHMQRFLPRAVKSVWSKRNVNIVDRLEREGRMKDAGRLAVEAAKADGRWDRAYSGSADLSEMQDLLLAIKADKAAQQSWDRLGKQERSMIYFQLAALKTGAGRAKRIRTFVERLRHGQAPLKAGIDDTRTKREAPSTKIGSNSIGGLARKVRKETSAAKSAPENVRTRSGRVSRSTRR